jgi:hypothetical protein
LCVDAADRIGRTDEGPPKAQGVLE